MVETILDVLQFALIITAVVLGLLWVIGRVTGILPAWANSSGTNARKKWALYAIMWFPFWRDTLGELLAEEKWTIPLFARLVWLILCTALSAIANAMKRWKPSYWRWVPAGPPPSPTAKALNTTSIQKL